MFLSGESNKMSGIQLFEEDRMNVNGGDSCHQFLTLHVNRLQQQLGTERREMRQIKGGTLKIMVSA